MTERSQNRGKTRFRVFVKDLALDAVIGIHEYEHKKTQPIRINLEMDVRLPARIEDRYENVVGYDVAARRIEAIVAEGGVRLVESLAERIVAALFEDPRIEGIKLRIEKLTAVPRTSAVGIEIERRRGES